MTDKRERKQISADYKYWLELSDLVGWTVMGFSFRLTCTYDTRDGNVLRMKGSQRDALVNAIKRGEPEN